MEHTFRLEQQWRAAAALFPTRPLLAASYVRQLMRIAREQSLALAPAFYWNACSRCGLPWYAGISCRVRLLSYRLIRSSMRRSPARYVLMGSLMSAPTVGRSERTACRFIVYECLGCGMRSVFDGHPQMGQAPGSKREGGRSREPSVGEGEGKEAIAAQAGGKDPLRSSSMDRKKLSQLQRILARSASVGASRTGDSNAKSSAADGGGIASFLKSLGNPDKKSNKKP